MIFSLISGAGGSSGPGDPFWSSVILLVGNDNAANNSTTFTDQSTNAAPIVAVGGAKFSSTTAPTGMTTSMLFNGTTDALWINSTVAGLDVPAGDYTVEMAVRKNANTTVCTLLGQQVGVGVLQYINMNSDQGAGNYVVTFQGGSQIVFSSVTSVSDVWRHCALVRSGTVTKLYMDGVQFNASSDDTGGANAFSLAKLAIAGQVNAGAYFQNGINGNIACLRVTKAARYTGAFTPPTYPFPTS